MPDAGDPLLDLLGYRDITKDGVTLPRRSLINFVGGAVSDNPTLGATDVNINGSAGDWKDSVRVATTAGLPNNTRVGNVITADANGVLADVDSVTLVLLDSLLAKDESEPQDNGIYTVTDLGSGSTPWVITRRDDADSSALVTSMFVVPISEGAVNTLKNYQMVTSDPIVLNSTNLVFQEFTGGAGSLSATLAIGNTTSGQDVVMTSGDNISGAPGSVGADLVLNGGAATATVGGDIKINAGPGFGGGTGGSIDLDLQATLIDVSNFVITNTGASFMTFGFVTAPENATTQGMYFDAGSDFCLAMLDATGIPDDLVIVGQTTTASSTGGNLSLFAGKGGLNGGALNLTAGEGDTTTGGAVNISSGTGATLGGDVSFNIPGAPSASPAFNFTFGGSHYARLGLSPNPSSVANVQGLYIGNTSAPFTFGFEPVTGASGEDLYIVSQESDTGNGGNLELHAGESAGASGGEAKVQGGNGLNTGGNASLQAGSSTSSGVGGSVFIDSGEGSAAFGGGTVNITASDGGTTGGDVIVTTGLGGTGDGGTVTLKALGSTSGDPGGIVQDVAALGDSSRWSWTVATTSFASMGQFSSIPTNGSSQGFYFDRTFTGDVVSIGHEDLASGSGAKLRLIGQTSASGSGGDLELVAGEGSTTDGIVSFGSGTTSYPLTASGVTGPALITTAQDVIGAINENADNVVGSVTTTDATPTALATFVTTLDGSTTKMNLSIIARDVTSGDRATWDVIVTASRNGSSVVVVLDDNFAHVFKEDVSWDITFTITSQTINILATGDATNNVNFELTGRAVETE